MLRNTLLVCALLGCVTLTAAPVPVRWTNPTEFTDGSALAAADIVATNIYCGPTAAVATTVQTITGSATSGTIELAGAAHCKVTTVARLGESVRESDYSAVVFIDPKRARAPVFSGLVTAPPVSCPAGTTCPAP